MRSRLSSKDAKVIMGAIGTMVIMNLADLEDFINIMVDVDDHAVMTDTDHIDYLSSILRTIDDDSSLA